MADISNGILLILIVFAAIFAILLWWRGRSGGSKPTKLAEEGQFAPAQETAPAKSQDNGGVLTHDEFIEIVNRDISNRSDKYKDIMQPAIFIINNKVYEVYSIKRDDNIKKGIADYYDKNKDGIDKDFLLDLFNKYCEKPVIRDLHGYGDIPINLYYNYIYDKLVQDKDEFVKYIFFLYHNMKQEPAATNSGDMGNFLNMFGINIASISNKQNVDKYYIHLLKRINDNLQSANISTLDGIKALIETAITGSETTGPGYYPQNIKDDNINYIIAPFIDKWINNQSIFDATKELLQKSISKKPKKPQKKPGKGQNKAQPAQPAQSAQSAQPTATTTT